MRAGVAVGLNLRDDRKRVDINQGHHMNRKTFLSVLLSLSLLAQQDVEKRLKDVAAVEPSEVRKLLADLQAVVRSGDRKAIGEMIAYPLRVQIAKKQVRLVNARDFEANYETVINDKVRQAILNQTFEKLFVNANGAMIGNGEVWISGVCPTKDCRDPKVRITAINP